MRQQPSASNCDLRPSLRALGPDGAFQAGLRSAFNLDPSDVAPLRLSAIGGCAVIFAYGIASPLLEVVALSLGMDILPFVTAGQTLLMFAVNPLYQYAQRRMLPTELIGIAYRLMAGMLLALEALATAWPHRRAVAYCLAVYGGIIATYPPALYNSFLASVHTRPEAKRVYGIIFFGKQAGLVLGSVAAGLLFERFGPPTILVACATYEATTHLVRHDGRGDDSGGRADCDAPDDASSASEASAARAEACCSSAFGGACIIARNITLRWLACYKFVSIMIYHGIWFERSELLTTAFVSDVERVATVVKLQLAYGCVTLPVQLLLFARLMRTCGYRGLLAVMPWTMITGLIASIVHPGLEVLLVLDTLRKVIDYTITKPALDTLYCDLHSDTLWLGRPLIDTLVHRMAMLCAAAVFGLTRLVGVQPWQRQCYLLLLSLVLAATSWRLTLLAGRSDRLSEPRKVLV
ncbi:hypothetical protein EMIHUDRAFT_213753 [Emiliania huxleyi CCMP1516]|uniref:Major facilitator superfamily associated domain-containing protein n=2 Tax=Emiliania huxleyi TaxID=2903 RepID=A0A0D3IMI0_EMIH1|nr:hypothetical protein EMIHUDRAFT_213753 [Emiliania huxleyi CCMP1516]EOD12465.1 hypothetical protein EMIHUDRAFT_213753 [Emiliania huxleyi CCMP1516]|eukprot:XP_005764894.1 hypothetical protein EMIHUDRAFT_213753 [Emiliania huxleyi CCMP1516]